MVKSIVCLMLVVSLTACVKKEREVPKHSESELAGQLARDVVVKEQEFSVKDMIEETVEPAKKKSLLRVWKKVPGHEFYRMVRGSDFNRPEGDKDRHYDTDVASFAGQGSDYGELSGAYGLVAFIVDKRITSKDRFSLVVFIERKGNSHSLHWVKRDEDLSAVTMGRHSGNVYLQELLDDGTTRFCDIQWDRKSREWDCKLTEVK